MHIKKTTGYVIGNENESILNSFARQHSTGSYRVTKMGYVQTLPEEREWRKSISLTRSQSGGNLYYQVTSNAEACEACMKHHGAIYPYAGAKEGINLPPFHPNCKCSVQEYSTDNPNADPWKAEVLLWLQIMYGEGTMVQKAKKILDYYNWTEFSVEFIADALSAIDDIEHIAKRMEMFFALLNKSNQNISVQITAGELSEFGWHNAIEDEATRLVEAFKQFGITTRESIIQFLAIAAAESGYGTSYLEGDYMSHEALLRYLSDMDYDIYERGAGYIQVTYRGDHLAFLEFMGDGFRGEDTAGYIAEHYPLEISVWYWTRKGYWDGGNNEFINTKMSEGGDPTLIFLKTAYYCGGMYNPKDFPEFNSDINAAIAGEADFTISDTTITINGRTYTLPSRWKERFEAYEKAHAIW